MSTLHDRPRRVEHSTTPLSDTPERCLVCDRAAFVVLHRDDLGPTVPLCEPHADYVHEVAVRDQTLGRSDRSLGAARPLDALDTLGMAPSSCDQCGATWTTYPGDRCPWCVLHFVRQLREQRAVLLDPALGYDPEDRRYLDAVNARKTRLLHAITSGLLDKDEARSVLERLVTTSRGAEAGS